MRPRTVLKVNQGQVGVLAFMPNSLALAVGVEGGDAQVWNAATEQLLGVLPGHQTVNRLVFSADGRRLATVSVETVRLWNVATNSLITVLNTDGGIISSVTFSPDSRTVATAGLGSPKVKLWDVETQRLQATLTHPEQERHVIRRVGDAEFSVDGQTLATVSFRTAYLWDLGTNRLRATLIDNTGTLRGNISHGSTIYKVAFNPNGRTLATASRDGTAKVWSVERGELLTTFKGHKGRVHRLIFSPDGRTLATASDDKTARLWETATGRLIATLQHRGTVWSLAFSPDGHTLATGSDNEKVVRLWDAVTGQLVVTLNGARYPAIFSPDGHTLASASRNANVLLWDVPVR